jgi:uncharacterized protein (TIGR02757 family)
MIENGNIGNLKEFLDSKAAFYNQPFFIESDPIQVPKQFSRKGDVEISAFISASLAWGQRPVIIRNSLSFVNLLENQPYEFLNSASEKDFARVAHFKHRTFNGDDAFYFLLSLKNIYNNHGGLQAVFETGYSKTNDLKGALIYFHKIFFETEGLPRTRKHVSDVQSGSAAKRLNMFLRWMVRDDKPGVDFGIWKGIPSSALMLPLDLHTARVARKLGLLVRKQNDWKAVEEVTSVLRDFDPDDPVKYDFALFGLGAFEKF